MTAEAGEEFPEQQRVAIDRLRQNARQRAPVMLAVDRVEAEADGHQRHQEAEEGDERRQRLARGGEQAQEQERILGGDRANLLDRAKDPGERHQHHQPFQHAHAGAGQMIR